MGYLYTLGESSIFFSKEYVDELDLKLRTLSHGGAAVYFRLITQDEEGTLVIPDCTSEENMRAIYYC